MKVSVSEQDLNVMVTVGCETETKEVEGTVADVSHLVKTIGVALAQATPIHA